MSNPNSFTDSWKVYDESCQFLQQALDKLEVESREHVIAKYGLSEGFQGAVRSEKDALELCEKAMETLHSEYVDMIASFRETAEATVALKSLERSEVIWRAESSLIIALDKDGEETAFLKRMRKQALTILGIKLEQVSKQCHLDPNDGMIALTIAILALMDYMYSEFGYPVESSERKKVRYIAVSFQ